MEDNPINQRVALLMLKKLGYSADVACNGLEALRALEQQNYDVILMDIQMPEMDGIEATKRIRRRSISKDTKIIAVTAHALEYTREECIAAGMDNYMTKPMTTEDLKAVLDRVKV